MSLNIEYFNKNLLLVFCLFIATFTSAADYYWVGNSGIWNNPANWASNSGGRGGKGIPDRHDDVHFDQRSFSTSSQTLSINTLATCRNFVWNIPGKEPKIAGNGAWNIHGHFQLITSIKPNFEGTFHFKTQQRDQPLHLGDHNWNADVYFDGEGSWVLQSKLATGKNIYLTKGTLKTAGWVMVCHKFVADGQQQRGLWLGRSAVVIRHGWDTEPSDHMDLQAGQSTLYFHNTVRTADIHLGNLTYNRIEHLDQPDNSNNSETNFGRACNTCATGIGEVPYTICAVIDTFFNGFGVSCKDSCDGTVFVGVNGGVGPFQYSWIGGPNTQQWSGVCAGNQIVIVTDLGQNTQCATTVNLLDPPRLSVLFSNYSPPTCSDACDGVLTVTPVGGVVPYNLCWNGPCPPGETTPTTTALCIGINNFRVTDENGCIFDSTYSINVPAPFFSNISTVDAQCNGVCDGYAISEPVGGNGGPYTWDWTDLGATTDSVGNLCAGTYAVSVFDNAGCRIDTIITISEPPAFNINLVLDVDLLCNNVCTGELEVSAENGTPPFSFQWYFSGTNNPVPGQNTAHATGLCAGDYYVVVTDGSGCSSPSGDFTISEPPLALIDVTTTDANCNGVCDGEATAVIVSGGVPPYTYQWYDTTGNPVPNGTGLIVFNLCSGDYYLEITDSANCLHRSDTVTVDESIEILVNISGFNATCSDSCNGSATVSISGGVAPYAIVWYDNNSGLPIGQAGLTATDLCDGDYYAEVTDANGCVEHSPIQNIAEPPPISITETGSDMSCNRWCDGTASVAVNGGLPGYTIIWYSHPSMVPTGLTGPSATGLCAGSYYAEITDAAGCTMTSNIITIAEPSAIDITSVPQNISCGGLCDGSIALNVSGGTPPYAIVWYNSANDSIGMGMAITALCAGDYYALISDTNGCTIQSPVETITEPPALNGNISGTDVTCNGDCEGTATFTPNGGAPPYNIEWYNSGDNPIGQNGTTAINLCAGDYYAIVTDANNCTDTSSAVTIAEPAALVAVLTTNNPSCGGTCDGSASVAVSGGTLPYTFNWSSGSNTSDTETGLCDNIYTVTVTDAAGCDTVINFILSEPSILLANANGTNPFCGGTCDGTVTSSPSGGTPPYSYQWTDGSNNPIGNQPSLSNLCPDTYTVVVTDANNCTINDVVNLTAPPAIIITQDSIVSASCGGACNGAVFITVTGGAPGYTFEWFPFGSSVPVSTSEDPTGLCPDNYTVVVTDATGCTATLNDVAVTTIPEVSAVLTITQPTCNDACDGAGMVVASDGQPPYTYNWQNSIGVTIGTTPNIGGLCPGNYSVEVTDNGGCTSATVLFTITAPTAMTATTDSTSVTCAGNCDGTATVNPSGGTGTLNVQWDVAANNQTAATAVNLCAGIYTATITDANGCAFDTTVTVTDPLTIVADIAGNDIRCFGICDGQAFVNSITNGTPPFTYAWFDSGNNPIAPGATDTASGLCLGTYYLVVTDANGCNATSNTITITEPPLLAASLANQTNNFCFGDCTGAATLAISGGTAPYVIVWDDPSAQTSVTAINLCAGTYTANVTDANGCTTAVNVALTEPAEILTTSSVVQVSCMGDCNGEATVGVVSGGTPPFTYSWDDPFSQNTPTAINLCAGTYSCTIADANGCNTSEVIAITEPAAIAINTSPVVPTCNGFCDGQIISSVSGGTLPYMYLWTDQMTGDTVGTTSTVTNLCAGTYDLVVTDANGCFATTSVALADAAALTANVSTTPSDCNQCNGTAQIVVSGGQTPYTYQWSPVPGTGQGTPVVTGLCQGVGNVLVTDAAGCTQVFPVVIGTVAGETLATNSADVSCNGFCDGTATVTIVGGCSSPACSIAWYNDQATAIGQNTNTATGLCAGIYIAEVTNAAGCVSFDTVVINEPLALDDREVITHIPCHGTCSGEIQVTPLGGDGNYTYAWSTGSNTTNTETNLCSGPVILSISDGGGCSAIFNYTLTEPAALDVTTTSASDVSCSNAANGTAIVFPAGGAPGYTYTWYDCATGTPLGQNTQQATGLLSGDYYVEVTDTNGCLATSSCITVGSPLPLMVSFTVTKPACAGDCNGSVTANASGGTPNYSYLWMDAGMDTLAGENGSAIGGLCAGDYFSVVTDLNGCTSGPALVAVTAPVPVDVTVSSAPVTCNGDCDGTASATVTGGNGFLSYQWYNAVGNPIAVGSSVLNLCADDYYVEVIDIDGCMAVSPLASVTEPAPLNGNIVVTDVLCNGDSTGSATAMVTGGTPPYAVQWLDHTQTALPGETTPFLSNVPAATFYLLITDSLGCVYLDTAMVTEPSPLTGTTINNPTACNVCSGSSTVNGSGGTPGYTYLWGANAANQTTPTATNLCAGIYTVTLTDNAGCTLDVVASINDTDAETVVVNTTSVTCFDDCDGIATAITACVDGPCMAEWFDGNSGVSLGQFGDTATQLCAGPVLVMLTNNSGCVTIVNDTVNAPAPMVAGETVTHVSCLGLCDGEITVTPSGGTGALTVLWPGLGGQTGTTVTGLCSGNYNVIISDEANCDTTYTIAVTEPVPITATAVVTDATCNGTCDGEIVVVPAGGAGSFTYQWQDGTGADIINENNDTISNRCSGSYQVVVTDGNGCSFTTPLIAITEPAALAVSTVATNASCTGTPDGAVDAMVIGGTPPYTYVWNPGGSVNEDINNIGAGNYNLTVTDSGGCNVSASATVNEPAAITASFATLDATCGQCNGEATANISGGAGGYTALWSNNMSGTQTTGLCSGIYQVDVTDGDGCGESFHVTLNNSGAPTVDNITATDASCHNSCDGIADVTVTGGIPPYTYNWLHNGNNTHMINNLCEGIYFLEIADALGCITVATVNINAPAEIIDNPIITPSACGYMEGVIAVTPTGGSGAGYTYNWVPNVTGQGTGTATNLGAEIYHLTITDGNGCGETFVYTMNHSTAPHLTVVGTDASCSGICDGSANATVTSGTLPYSFNWTDANGVFVAGTEGLGNACAGIYTLEVTDGAGCSSYIMATIDEPETLTASFTFVQPASCAGVCDGAANVNITGGVLPYTFAWTNGAGNPIGSAVSDSLTHVCADAYGTMVQDANGCTFGPVGTVVTEPAPIAGTFNITNAACNQANGSAEVLPSGGTSPYAFQWFDMLSNPLTTNPVLSNAVAGVYSVEITDSGGCSDIFTTSISNTNSPVILLDSLFDVSCNSECDGSIAITATAGTPPYAFQWNNGSSVEDLSGLCAGTYTVQATDAAGCLQVMSFVVGAPMAISANATVTDATCGGCNGSATVVPSGGTPPYTYLWNIGGTGNTGNGLCAGVYDVQITDAVGCSEIIHVTVNTLGGPTGETIVTTPASCFDACDGTAQVTPVGGVSPYTYHWMHNGHNLNTHANLCAGTYFLIITDANGCSRTATVVVDEPSSIIDSTIVIPPTCGNNNGIINMTIFGGTGPYMYQWNAPLTGTNPVVNNVPAGIYTCVVTDANGCTQTVTITMPDSNAPDVIATSTNVRCFGGCDGKIDNTGISGTPGYSFDLFDGSGSPMGGSGINMSGLCAGDYIVRVTDAAGCVSFDPVTVHQPDSITFNLPVVVEPTCSGTCNGEATVVPVGGELAFGFNWLPGGEVNSTAIALCAGTHNLTVTDNNGCTATATVTVNDAAPITLTIDHVTDVPCLTSTNGTIDITTGGGASGFTYGWTGPGSFFSNNEDLTGLSPGDYMLTVTDANNCTLTDTVTVHAQAIVTADAGPDITICEDRSVWLYGNGGLTYEWYDMNGILLGSTDSIFILPFTGVACYVLVATDGLCFDPDTVCITAFALPVADAGEDRNVEQGTTITIGGNPTGASGSTYLWTPGDFLSDSTHPNPTYSVEQPTTFYVTVTSPAGCISIDSVTVTPVPEIGFSNGITPNGDGFNDVWIIDRIEEFPESVVEIYNRWGHLLFRSVGYVEQWDGKFNGEDLPVGTYYYVIDLKHALFPKAYTGPITILR